MEIRSVTLFVEPAVEPAAVAPFLAAARTAFHVPVQSTRLATTPFPDWWPADADVGATAQAFAARWAPAGLDYLCVGPVRLTDDARWLDALPALLNATDRIFASAEIADGAGRIDPARAARVAQLVQKVSTLQDNGFGNLYLTAIANCPPGSPFFPVAYHGGGAPCFAIAVEAADLAVAAIQGAGDLAGARRRLVDAIEREAGAVVAEATALQTRFGLPFRGIDFSLAPFPTVARSLAGAMEALGLPWVGASGSLFAAAFITDAIGRANFPRVGFSGLMLPVLEDAVLAASAAGGHLSVSDLLTYAAVCGVGLDTVPLPGDIPAAALQGILLDVAALAVRLNKPLTARLMPLPGKAAGDSVAFDFPYFADSRVMPAAGEGVGGLLSGAAPLTLNPYHVGEVADG